MEASIGEASNKQLLDAVLAVVLLADNIADFAEDENSALIENPVYKYRNLPCSILPDDQLWCVSGVDLRGGSGILEWACDEQDAKNLLESMNQYDPCRFENLSVEKFTDAFAAR